MIFLYDTEVLPIGMRAVGLSTKYSHELLFSTYQNPSDKILSQYKLQPSELPTTILFKGKEVKDINDPNEDMQFSMLRGNGDFYDVTEFLRPW